MIKTKRIFSFIAAFFALAVVLCTIIIPFANNLINVKIANIIWYPCFSLTTFGFIVLTFKYGDNYSSIPLFVFLGKWASIVWPFVLLSAFVFNYYSIKYFWEWIIFFFVIIVSILFFITLFSFNITNKNLKKHDKEKQAITCVFNIALYLVYDLFYLSLFNRWNVAKYCFGIVAIVLIFYKLIETFLADIKQLYIFLAFDLIFGVGLSVYLIYCIQNSALQRIVLTLVASLYGGLLTLVGVAWTIKKGDKNRKKDFEKIESDRKAEEIKKHIPYIKICYDICNECLIKAKKLKNINFDSVDDIKRIKDNVVYLVDFEDFSVKNISGTNIIFKGIFLNDEYYDFEYETLVENNSFCTIEVTGNSSYTFFDKLETIMIKVSDVLGNDYIIPCQMIRHTEAIGKCYNDEYDLINYKYSITNVLLPKVVEKDKN